MGSVETQCRFLFLGLISWFQEFTNWIKCMSEPSLDASLHCCSDMMSKG